MQLMLVSHKFSSSFQEPNPKRPWGRVGHVRRQAQLSFKCTTRRSGKRGWFKRSSWELGTGSLQTCQLKTLTNGFYHGVFTIITSQNVELTNIRELEGDSRKFGRIKGWWVPLWKGDGGALMSTDKNLKMNKWRFWLLCRGSRGYSKNMQYGLRMRSSEKLRMQWFQMPFLKRPGGL